MTAFQREINRVFDDFSGDFDIDPFGKMEERLGRFAPCTNVSETSKEIKVNAELPGMEEKYISVTLEDDTLILSGERKEEKKKKMRSNITVKYPTALSGG